MIKLIKDNLREILAILVTIGVLFALLLALGTVEVSESGPLSTLVSLAVTLIGGVAKFAVALALAWFGLAITLPEGNRFIIGQCFDTFWTHSTQHQKGNICLIAVAVLAIVAALCMSAS